MPYKVVIADDDATQRISASSVISRIGFTPILGSGRNPASLPGQRRRP
jgi:hypothetical protein